MEGQCPVTALSDSFLLSNELLEKTMAKARSESPVTYLPDIGYWAVTKFDDIKAILGDPTKFSAEITLDPLTPFSKEVENLLKERNFRPEPTLSNNTRDDHPRIKRNAQLAFSNKRLKQLDAFIRNLVNQAIDEFTKGDRADLVSQMVYELPALVLFELLGVPHEDVPRIKKWADNRLLLTFGKLNHDQQLNAAEHLADYWDYCVDLVQKRIKEPANDLPSDMLAVRNGDDDILTIDNITNVVFGLLLAGHETTTNASANAILVMLQQEGVWQKLGKQPELIKNAVEEALRFRSSVVAWRRLVKEPVEISGSSIAAGERVLCFLASGNRDESRFEDGDSFDIERSNSGKHISFGFGNHFCIGAPVARLQLQIILEIMSQRLPNLRLSDGQSFEMVEVVQFRGPKELWVEGFN